MTKKYILNFVILMMMLFLFTGCTGIESETKEASIEDKAKSEIEYLEDEIFTVLNKYSKDEYMTDDNATDWKEVNSETQKIGKVLDTMLLDFGEAKISNEELNKFRTEINNLLISTSSEDEYTFFYSASNLYSLLPDYYGKFSEDNNKKDIMALKSLVLKSYINSRFLEWDGAKANANFAENKYKEMSDNLDYMKEYSYNLNKTYVLLEEFKNAVDAEQSELSKIKYINFIEKTD